MTYSLPEALKLSREQREQLVPLLMEKARRALEINFPVPHPAQREFINSPAKRKIIRAGRRGGKTVGAAILALNVFRTGRRILYATPTAEQLDRFWKTVTRALEVPLSEKRLYKNETEHVIERLGTENRIRAKTAWNADTLRGDYADLLILDEWQLMNEDAWERVGAPMLLDNDGDAVFIYTPPSLQSRSVTKANDPLHAAKMFKAARGEASSRWAAFHFASHANPHISETALAAITQDMTALAIQQEIEALDLEEAPGALWSLAVIDAGRRTAPPLSPARVIVAVDPSTSGGGNEAGIITVCSGMCDCLSEPELHGFVLADNSLQGAPSDWATAAVTAYHIHRADRLVAESNQGGEMVSLTVQTITGAPPVSLVHASRGKATRAEPISVLYSHGRIHHVGHFALLEQEMTQWTPGKPSPNRMDALVWGLTALDLQYEPVPAGILERMARPMPSHFVRRPETLSGGRWQRGRRTRRNR